MTIASTLAKPQTMLCLTRLKEQRRRRFYEPQVVVHSLLGASQSRTAVARRIHGYQHRLKSTSLLTLLDARRKEPRSRLNVANDWLPHVNDDTSLGSIERNESILGGWKRCVRASKWNLRFDLVMSSGCPQRLADKSEDFFTIRPASVPSCAIECSRNCKTRQHGTVPDARYGLTKSV